jgi:hypothetical protein
MISKLRNHHGHYCLHILRKSWECGIIAAAIPALSKLLAQEGSYDRSNLQLSRVDGSGKTSVEDTV